MIPQILLIASLNCTSKYDWHVYPNGLTQYGETDWESNPCGFTMQVRATCQTPPPLSQFYDVYSGEVKGNEIQDKANCDFASKILALAVDSQDTNHWVQVWP